MAVIGHAEIVVRAITNNFENQLKDTLKNVSKSISVGAGRRIGDGFADGFNRSRATTVFGKLADGLRSMTPEAEAARERFQSLVRVGYTLNGVLGLIAGAVSSVVVSIGPLIGSLLKAASASAILLNAFVALRVAIAVGRTAFGNIFQAVKQATEVNGGYSKSLKDIREEWQQLLFDAEAASMGEEEAALNLEKAFNNLRRMADLPPNSMARREAELEYRQADLAYRRAKDRTEDLNETVQEGFDAFKDAQRTAGGAGADPLSQLNAAQRKFAERLIKLNPKLDKLKLKMSEAFLAPLYETVDVFEKRLLPILDVRLPEIAGQAGEAINQVFTGLDFQAVNDILAEMTTPFEEGGRSNLQLFGDILENILGLFLKILDATGKPLNEALTDIADSIKSFTEGLDENKLEQFFIDAKNEAVKWFAVVGNIFGGFRNLINLTTGPGSAGEYMLQWFTEASESFKNMFAEDPDAGKKFFKDAMVNARAVLSAIGQFVKEILGVADNPNIATAFNTLKESAPAFGDMLDKVVDAAPSFATLVTEIIEFLNILTDSNQIEAFFDTLTGAVSKVNDALKSPLGQAFLDNLGPIFATLSAVGLIFDAIKFGFQVLVGYLAFTMFFMDGLTAKFAKLGSNIKILFTKPLPKGQMGPLTQAQAAQQGLLKGLGNFAKGAGLVGLVVFLVTKATEFYDKFEDFKEMVDGIFGDLGKDVEELFASFSNLFDTLFGQEGIGGILSAFDPIVKFLLEIIIPAMGVTFGTIIDGAKLVVNIITSILDGILPPIKTIIGGLMLLFKDPVAALQTMIAGVIQLIFGMVDGVVNSIVDVLNFLIERFEGTVRAIGNSPLGDLARDLFGWDLKNFKIGRVLKIDLAGAIGKNIQSSLDSRKNQQIKDSFSTRTRANGLPKLAMGGTVYPSMGGTVVNVAEAGRPERIEPLDATGLSQRDRAIIQQLSGGGISITVNPSPGMNEKELAAAVSRRLAFEMRKGTI